MGVPRSGKSTWVKTCLETTPVVSPDSIRLSMHGHEFIAAAEAFVWATATLMVKSLFEVGHHTVILDSTNTTKDRRVFWESKDWNREIHVFETPVETCLERAIATEKPFLVPVINRMSDGWQRVGNDEGFRYVHAHYPDGKVFTTDMEVHL